MSGHKSIVTCRYWLTIILMSVSVSAYCLPDRDVFNTPKYESNSRSHQFVGIYKSKITSGGQLLPGNTVFSIDGDGLLVAKFKYREKSGFVHGHLSQCKQDIKVRMVYCIWTDKYGVGFVTLYFDADFDSFTARWGVKGTEQTFLWTGQR